jgi:hypothetical protein
MDIKREAVQFGTAWKSIYKLISQLHFAESLCRVVMQVPYSDPAMQIVASKVK